MLSCDTVELAYNFNGFTLGVHVHSWLKLDPVTAGISRVMACSNRRRGQDSFVLSRPSFQFSTNSLFTPPTRTRKKLSCLVCSCVHTANATRQDSFVLSASAVWTSQSSHRVTVWSRVNFVVFAASKIQEWCALAADLLIVVLVDGNDVCNVSSE